MREVKETFLLRPDVVGTINLQLKVTIISLNRFLKQNKIF
jgi:hypothetical protein